MNTTHLFAEVDSGTPKPVDLTDLDLIIRGLEKDDFTPVARSQPQPGEFSDTSLLSRVGYPSSELSRAFLSRQGLEGVQTLLYNSVLKLTTLRIDRQNEDHILSTMLNVYVEAVTRVQQDTLTEVSLLTQRTVDFLIGPLIKNLRIQLQFIVQQRQPISLMTHPISTREFNQF